MPHSARRSPAVRSVMKNTNAHIVAMTGSYFRGDAIPVLEPEDEAMFQKITYNYYEQLDGYTYLKSLGIGYHFYQGRYTEASGEILDTDKKTEWFAVPFGVIEEAVQLIESGAIVDYTYDPASGELHLKP